MSSTSYEDILNVQFKVLSEQILGPWPLIDGNAQKTPDKVVAWVLV